MIESALLHHYESRQWLSFKEPVAVLHARKPSQVMPVLGEIEARVEAEQLTAVGFITYEAACGFDASLPTHSPAQSQLPLISFALFRSAQVAQPPVPRESGAHQLWRFTESAADYRQAIGRIRELIKAGDVYQINHTTRLQGVLNNPQQLFADVAAGAPFGAYLEGDSHTIVSASPECFFALDGNTLYSQPMKGTAAREQDPASDQAQRDWLSASTKNRAENLMITDMVRNDLGRVAEPGTVRTSALFATERYPTVWQMTSRVEASTSASVADIFAQLFPAASITGAPKRAAMGQIKALEKTPREIYTGAIGMIAPGRQVQFNVAIRTAWVENRTGAGRYGAGGGIVWDSDAQEEHDELVSKTQILSGVTASEEFELFETMGWTANDGPSNLAAHFKRMSSSAEYFGIAFNAVDATQAIEEATAACGPPPASTLAATTYRLRLSLSGRGMYAATLQPRPPPIRSGQKLAVAPSPVWSEDPALVHKTNQRQVYVQARQAVTMVHGEGVEPLLINERGEVTETDIANVVYVLDGQKYTPPARCGLLPGVLRERLLGGGDVQERVLLAKDLASVDKLYLINDLRGWREAWLLGAKTA
jgi:para-aminobenzoate synthetase/4-amino-4-deoxychorismate lyase